MKVRITDLLDDYYDKSVKLNPPPESLPSHTRVPPQRRQARKPLLVAAALLLIVTTTAALGFGILQVRTTGHSLAEAEDSTPVPASDENLEQLEPENPVEVTPEPTIAASAWEDDGQETAERIPFEVSSYTQRGNKLQFSLRIHDVPVGYTVKLQPGDVYSNIINEAQVEDVTGLIMGEGWEESGDRAIDVTVELTEAGGPLVFRAACCDENDNWVFTEPTSIPVADFDHFESRANYGIYEYCMEVPSDSYATVRQLIVTQDTLMFFIEAPVDVALVEGEIDLADEALVGETEDWANTLVSITQSNLLRIYMDDGSTADITAEGYDCVLLSAGLSGENGIANIQLTINLKNAIDPLAIDTFELDSQEVLPEIVKGPFDAEDPDGDGYLTVNLNLPISQDSESSPGGTLTRLTIDLSNGDYTWYYTSEALQEKLSELSQAGDETEALTEALHDETFMLQSTVLANDLARQYLTSVRLIFTDGTWMNLGSGVTAGYTEGEFTTTYSLGYCAADGSLDITGLTIDHLEIGGERYNFQ